MKGGGTRYASATRKHSLVEDSIMYVTTAGPQPKSTSSAKSAVPRKFDPEITTPSPAISPAVAPTAAWRCGRTDHARFPDGAMFALNQARGKGVGAQDRRSSIAETITPRRWS
jgi:hypothetical protein